MPRVEHDELPGRPEHLVIDPSQIPFNRVEHRMNALVACCQSSPFYCQPLNEQSQEPKTDFRPTYGTVQRNGSNGEKIIGTHLGNQLWPAMSLNELKVRFLEDGQLRILPRKPAILCHQCVTFLVNYLNRWVCFEGIMVSSGMLTCSGCSSA